MNRRGFTLIELLVVISIIGLISSVALANFQSAKEKAREAAGKQFQATVHSSLGAELMANWDFEGLSGEIVTPEDPGEIPVGGTPPLLMTGGVTYVGEGVSGPAVLFDGDFSYLSGANFPDPGENTDLTITAWVKPSDVLNENTIFFQGNHAGVCSGFEVGINGGYASANGTITTDERVLINNVWQNLAFVFKSGTDGNPGSVDTYVNGTKVGTKENIQTHACDTGEWAIGARLSYFGEPGDEVITTDYNFNGQIDGVYVYGSAF